MKIFLSGKLVDEKDAVVSVFDHGLLYGDAVRQARLIAQIESLALRIGARRRAGGAFDIGRERIGIATLAQQLWPNRSRWPITVKEFALEVQSAAVGI